MTPMHRRILLVFLLPLLAAVAATPLLESFGRADRAPDPSPRAPSAAAELLEAQSLAAYLEAPELLASALTPWPLSAEALAAAHPRGATSEPALPIPEPRSGLLLALGLAGLAARRR